MIWNASFSTTKRITVSVLALGLCLGPGGVLKAVEDPPLYVPKKPRAPLDVRRGSAPAVSLTPSESGELRGEFGGYLYMGREPYSYERWPGKDMSDCRPEPSSGCDVCELIMGHSSADFYFYKQGAKGACT